MKKNYLLKSVATVACFAASLFLFQTKAETVQTTADTVSIGNINYALNDDALTADVVALPGGVKYSGNLVIPASVSNASKTYAVVKIGNGSLRDAPALTSVTIPEGLKVIGNSSFASCTALTSITLPSSVNSIEDWAFYGCTNLASINIPNGITAIGEHLFQLSGLTSITLPASVTSLKTCAFQDASKLASINLENITTIGAWSLYGTALQSVNISNVATILSEAFGECQNLETVKLTNVGTAGDWAFKNCKKLKNVDLGALESINQGVFSGCSALTSLAIPTSVIYLGNWALEKTGLTEVIISWENPAETLFIEEFAFGKDDGKPNFTWKVPAGLKDLYGDTWSGFPVSVQTTTGIKSLQNENVKAYYNNGILNMVNMAGYQVSIYSVGGQKLAHFQVTDADAQIPVSLPVGIYLLNAINADSKTIIKFIVK